MAIAKWKKIDFHTHTPASRCFKNRDSVSPRQWINAAKKSGLDAVVITDHNSVGWIGKLRGELKEEDELFLYPGVELCVGRSFTHIIVIFNPDMSTEEIEEFMVQCGLSKNHWGDTNKHVEEKRFVEVVNKHRKEVLVIPAHFNCNKGICKTLGHNGLKSFYKTMPFDAVEVRSENDLSEVKNKIINKAIPELAIVTGSDNPGRKLGTHDLIGFAEKYTWVKISEYSLEALRQAFLDYKTRIIYIIDKKQKDINPNYIGHNYIAGMIIKDLKHVDELDFRFSPNLNCIIGGRGTGKSTIIEMIRKVLRKFDENNPPQIFNTYQYNSQIKLFYNFGTENRYCIELNGDKPSVFKDKDGKIDCYPAFPVSIYSQKELFNIAEDNENPEKSETSPLLNIIDENIFEIKADFQEKKDAIKKDILTLTEQLLIFKDQIKEIPKLQAEIELEKSKLSKIKSTGVLEKREKLNKLKEPYIAIKSNLKEYEKITDEIQTIYSFKSKDILSRIKLNLDNELICSEDKRIINVIYAINDSLIGVINASKMRLRDAIIQLESSVLKENIDKNESEYDKLLEELEYIDIDDFKQIEAEATQKNIRLKKLKGIEKKAEEIEKQIVSKIMDFIRVHAEISKERKRVIDNINSKAKNIRLSIKSLSDGERWLYKIRKELGKEQSFDTDFRRLKDKLFKENILNEQQFVGWLKFILLSDDGDIQEFLGKESIYDSRFSNIWIEKREKRTLHTLINFVPEDRIEIQIKNKGGLKNINEGSPGQKTAAILAFILNQGKHPLIIDQPEDDLDNSLIIDLIVETIRNLKSNRQVIIATHNPNIPVLGDAEGIIMLDRNKEGKVIFKNGKKTGCIEEKTIKKGICDIMEGGIDALRKREKKYKYVED